MDLSTLAGRVRAWRVPPLVGWQRTAAWAGLGVFLFALFLALTFPYDAVRARIASEADAAGLWVRIDAMGPALLGVSARGVRVGERPDGLGPPEATVRVDRLTLRPSLYPWGVGFSASLLGGTAGGAIGTGSAPKLRVHFDRLSLGKAGVGALTGVDAVGTLNGELSLDIPAGGPQGGQADLSQASGRITLSATGLEVKGGTVTIPLMGQMTPVDLPPVNFGQLDADLSIDKGLGTLVKPLRLEGPELDIQGTGTVRLARAVAYSEPDVTLRIRPMPDFLRRMGMIAAGFTQLPVDPADSAYRNAKVTGYLGKPNVRPGR
ncbi:MAG TPA: type II secretion system protein GspN [Myxococcaceae bacterium]|nr:type II secretion system protein GspN [Myxococcaceae bacterium]